MTSRQELVALAKASALPGTQPLLTAIEEAHLQMGLATWQLSVRVKSAEMAKEAGSYQAVGSFVKEASDYESAAAKLNTLFLTLAIVLQSGGVPIEY